MTFGRSVYITGIRVIAKNIVGDCSDYQIIFCALKAKVISDRIVNSMAGITSIENLDDYDIQSLYDWMSRQ